MKLGTVENWETEIRIEQYILAREIRETTRKGTEKRKPAPREAAATRYSLDLLFFTSL